MIHRIDGKVAIVGVIDLTADSLSSVYLYYDPKYEFLNPGTLSALREIEYIKKVRESGAAPATFKWYYMGLYYQDCKKSVYKANYKPSMVACPHTYTFVYLTEEVKNKISSEKMPRLTPDAAPSSYPLLDKMAAKEKGMRTTLKTEDGNQLTIYTLNKYGQKLLVNTLPELFAHIGSDLVDNIEFII